MIRIRSAVLVLLATLCAAADASAQRAADLSPHAQPAPASAPLRAAPPLLATHRDSTVALLPSSVETLRAGAARPLSVTQHTLIGALTGAVVGLAPIALDRNCWSGDSMCGLAIPVLSGGGAVMGGLVGYVVGRIRN